MTRDESFESRDDDAGTEDEICLKAAAKLSEGTVVKCCVTAAGAGNWTSVLLDSSASVSTTADNKINKVFIFT